MKATNWLKLFLNQVFLWILVGLTFAGHYEVAYNGGKLAVTEPTGPKTITFTSQGSQWGANYTEQSAPCGIKCGTTITATLTWTKDFPSDTSLPPPAVVLRKFGEITVSGLPSSINTGLSPQTGGANGKTAEVFEVINSPGWTITKQISPSGGTKTNSNGSPASPAAMSARFRVSAYNITMALDGTIKETELNYCMIGKRITAAAVLVSNALGIPELNVVPTNWNVSGDVFDFYRTEPDLGERIDVAASIWVSPSPSWIWNVGGSPQTVSCEGDVMMGSTKVGGFSVSSVIQVEEPEYEFTSIAAGLNEILLGPLSARVTSAGNSVLLPGDKKGIIFRGYAVKPPKYIPLYGYGTSVPVQLCKLNHSVPPITVITNGFVLDNEFPYAPGSDDRIRSNGLPQQLFDIEDTPSQSIWVVITLQVYHINDRYEMNLMYRPCTPAQGDFVPLHLITWDWLADYISAPLDTGTHVLSSVPSVAHPTWNEHISTP